MDLLLDIFGFVSVILSGLVRAGETVSLGTLLFLALIAGRDLPASVETDLRRMGRLAFLIFSLFLLAHLALHVAILAGTLDGDLDLALSDAFAIGQGLRLVAAIAGLLLLRTDNLRSRWLLLLPVLLGLAAAVGISHAAARLEDRSLLAGATFLHYLAAALWIGGLPGFLVALTRLQDQEALTRIAHRYSRAAMLAVLLLLISAIPFLVFYIGAPSGLYGTAYGMMLATKIVLFLTVLGLGAGNFLALRRLTKPNRPTVFLRLRRFVEVELGIGLTILFVAAAMTSLPPAIDLVRDRASLGEIAARLEPRWPSLVSPDRDSLAINQLEKTLAEQRARPGLPTATAYVPGSGTPLPRNAEDIAWSEYNHHWSGVIVLLAGLLALLERASWGWLSRQARHWPLLFALLAFFLFRRSEAESWPFGPLSLGASLRDPEFVQHKVFMALILGFAGFEWSQRMGYLRRQWVSYVLPLLAALGGAMLLTHSHSLANVKELLLVEMTHMPLAVFGIWAGWARWLELRLADGPMRRFCGWTWPICFALVGILLLLYREI